MDLTPKGPYQPMHLVFLVVFLFLFALGIAAVKKNREYPGRIAVMLKVLSVVQLLLVIIRRVATTRWHIMAYPGQYSWLSVLPDSFCSFASIGLALSILFGKRNCKAMHFFAYVALFGGFFSTVYPSYLAYETMFSLTCFAGLSYHAMDVFLVAALLVSRRFVPSFRKIPCFLAGYTGMMLFGLFEIVVLGYPEAMNLLSPLVQQFPVLTSWYSLTLGSLVGVCLTIAVYRKLNRKMHPRPAAYPEAGVSII